MPRYIEDAGLNQPIDVVSMLMEDYIYHHRFMRTDWNGEPVYCCRDAHGKERYLVWSYASGILHLEAWVKGAFGNEANLSGGSGKEYRKSLEELLKKLREHSGDTSNIGYIGEDPFIHKETEAAKPIQSAQPTYQQPKPVQPAYQQPKPVQPVYQQPKPAQPTYQQPKPAQPAYQQPKPAQTMPQQPRPAQPAYQQSQPAQGMPYRPQGTSYGNAGAPYNPQGASHGPQGSPYGSQGNPYGPQGNPYGVPSSPYGIPEDNAVMAAMIMGIIGIVFSFLVPFLGMILGIIGKSRSRMSDTTAGKGRTASILCTVAIILSVLGFFIPFVFMFSQF
ncbi:MAG: hypothetical protein J1E83_07850 [Lachnospiraceae bacterium]|nr:hypothetical protein [Lachnospiraceae bacterium]